jgi:2-succinyl-5-enolpyruvyl-6-hydroxy-3-cyclohexene-1-carboxylate synthase
VIQGTLIDELFEKYQPCFAGLRVGASERSDVALVHHFDHLLLDKEALWPALRPDVVLQLGGRLVSKRAAQFLEWAAQPLPKDDRCLFFLQSP